MYKKEWKYFNYFLQKSFLILFIYIFIILFYTGVYLMQSNTQNHQPCSKYVYLFWF